MYRKDIQGNIIAILDSNGNLIVKYRYDAWGNHRVFGLNKIDEVEVLQDIYDENAPEFDVEYLKYKQLSELKVIMLKESIRQTQMSKLLENSPDLYKFVYEYAKQIGTKGQNKARIVFTKLGKIITFFPE